MIATLFACLHLSQASPLVHFLIILPLQDVKGPTAGWERGLEILPGAQIAQEMINNSSVLQGRRLQLIPIDSGTCSDSQVDRFKFLPQLMNSTLNQGLNVKAVIGLLCPNEIRVPFDSLSSISSVITKAALNTQPTMLINTLLSFMEYMEWSRIGIITELNHLFFFNTAEAVAKAIEDDSNFTISKFIQAYVDVQNIVESDFPKLIFLSVGPPILEKVLCSAYRQNLLWPKHVWILHSYRIIDFLINENQRVSCNVSKALEGAILIQEQLTLDDNDKRYSNFYDRYIMMLSNQSKQRNIAVTLQPNAFSYIAYDLVWGAALTLSSRKQKTNGTISHQPQRNMNIIQVKGHGESHIATYSFHLGQLSVHDREFKDRAPSDELPLVVLGVPVAYTIMFSILLVIVFVVETSVLTLYICFHKEPEIKSTSFSLSLLMFLGCYLCNVYTPISLYFQQPLMESLEVETALCHVRLWLSNVGIYFIEATLLVKILRVYHIFFRYKAKPIGKNCSDIFLAFYVLIILSPSIIIHVLWSFVDNYGSILLQTPNQQYVEVEKSCGPIKPVWYILLTVYGYSLSTALVTVAIKTRKIRHKQFKDTKKVNMYLFCFTIVTAMTFGFWLFLDRSNTYEYYLSLTPVHIGLSMIVLLCQFLLFMPKVLPPLKRYIMVTWFNRTVYN